MYNRPVLRLLSLILLSLVGSGCRADCAKQDPAFLIDVYLPSMVDGSRISCLAVSMSVNDQPQPTKVVSIDGQLADRRTSVAVVNLPVAGDAAFTADVTAEACTACPGDWGTQRCAQALAWGDRSFAGLPNACNVFDLHLVANILPDGPAINDRGGPDVRDAGRRDLGTRDLRDGAPDRPPDLVVPSKDLGGPTDLVGFEADIGWVLSKGYMALCSTSPPPKFCPTMPVTRRALATAVVQMKYGIYSITKFPFDQVQHFNDVLPSDAAFPYIQRAKQDGAMGGYPDGNFKPENSALRWHATKAIVMMKFKAGVACPSTPAFNDLDTNSCPYVQKAYDAKITYGATQSCAAVPCSSSCFCPFDELQRQHLAAFLHRAQTL
jgi:hypothetical protein